MLWPELGIWTSIIVMIARKTKTRRYGFRTPCTALPTSPRHVSVCVSIAISEASNQIHDREQEDPHDVNEVPIEADELDGLVVRLGEPVFLPRLVVEIEEAEHPARYVGAVEPRLHVERGAERSELGADVIDPWREMLPEEERVVLEQLDRHERRAEDQGREEVDPEPGHAPVLDSLQGLDHREAARDEDERVDRGEGDVEGRVRGGVRPERRAGPEGEGVPDDRGEEHDLGDEEDPHPELPLAHVAEHAGLRPGDDIAEPSSPRVLQDPPAQGRDESRQSDDEERPVRDDSRERDAARRRDGEGPDARMRGFARRVLSWS